MSDEEKLSDNIIGDVAYDAPELHKRKFLPWHRPRKQFVRDQQWRSQINQLLDDFPLDGAMFRYLGLPGEDLLDIRYFHDTICVPRACLLHFLGFNSDAKPNTAAGINLNISMDEVRKLPNVDPNSDVILDNICQLGDAESLAWRRAQQHGNYDVVNLDLCNGFALHQPDSVDLSHYDALIQLLSLQARRSRPWLLFLTTRAGPDHINFDVWTKILDVYSRNLADCSSFMEASKQLFSISLEAELRQSQNSDNSLLSVFLTGLCKWLLGCGLSHRPPTEVELRNAIGYRVKDGAKGLDLMSLALRFVPTMSPVRDPQGWSSLEPAPARECELATQFVAKVHGRADVDALLAASQELKGAMTNDMANLLESARYSRSDYMVWANAI